jgi:hypothetical protein
VGVYCVVERPPGEAAAGVLRALFEMAAWGSLSLAVVLGLVGWALLRRREEDPSDGKQ